MKCNWWQSICSDWSHGDEFFSIFFYWTKCTKDFSREMLLQKCQVFELKLKLIEIQYSTTQSDSCFFLSYRIKLNSERITLCNKKLNDIKQTCRICNENNKNTTNLFAFIIKEQILIIIDKWKPYLFDIPAEKSGLHCGIVRCCLAGQIDCTQSDISLKFDFVMRTLYIAQYTVQT